MKKNDDLDLTGPPTIEEIYETVKTFCGRHKIAETNFSQAATGNLTLVYYLKRGRDIRLETAHKIYRYMREYEELIG